MTEQHKDVELEQQHQQLDLRAVPAETIDGMPSAQPQNEDAPIVEVGSYGRGIYAGHSTYDRDYRTQGSYGRGIYAGHSTFHLDFRRRDSFARGMEQRPAKETGRRDKQTKK